MSWTSTTRYLAIDLGDKRTGLAVGDTVVGIASPVDLIEVPITERNGESLIDAIDKAIDEHVSRRSTELVFGLPINMDGTEGPRAKLVRDFASRVGVRTKMTLHFQDERLSSAKADKNMARTGLTHKQKKARRDAIAAAAFLQAFLDARRQPPHFSDGFPAEDESPDSSAQS